MATLILWRPLTFWDEEQIQEIKFIEQKSKIKGDSEIQELVKEYKELEYEIEILQSESEDKYSEILLRAWKYWISKNELFRVI